MSAFRGEADKVPHAPFRFPKVKTVKPRFSILQPRLPQTVSEFV
jgi:hypothetical protein